MKDLTVINGVRVQRFSRKYERAAAAVARANELRKIATTELAEIRNLIRAGAGTEDPILDYVLRWHGWCPELVEGIRRFRQEIIAHKGEYFVIEGSWLIQMGILGGSIMLPVKPGLEPKIIIASSPSVVIRVHKFESSQLERHQVHDGVGIARDALSIGATGRVFSIQSLCLIAVEAGRVYDKLHIGTEAVDAWWEGNRRFDFFNQATKMLDDEGDAVK